jgi:hypothetical protein
MSWNWTLPLLETWEAKNLIGQGGNSVVGSAPQVPHSSRAFRAMSGNNLNPPKTSLRKSAKLTAKALPPHHGNTENIALKSVEDPAFLISGYTPKISWIVLSVELCV